MTTQTQNKIISASNIFEILFSAVFSPSNPPSYTPADFGFEVEEEELADEMSAQNSDLSLDQTTSPVASEEFDSLYNWFLS